MILLADSKGPDQTADAYARIHVFAWHSPYSIYPDYSDRHNWSYSIDLVWSGSALLLFCKQYLDLSQGSKNIWIAQILGRVKS